MAIQTKDATATESKLKELLIDQLQDIYWAESKLVQTLPKMEEAATTQQLKNAFSRHLEQTKTHVSRLEEVFNIIGSDAKKKTCPAMEGLVEEGERMIKETDKGSAQRDAGLILAAQKVEHYEIATYGSLAQLAKTIGYTNVTEILGQTLAEEKTTDELLTQIAETGINYKASQEPE